MPISSTVRKKSASINDQRELKARVLGLDRASDVAVLKINGRQLPTVRLGTSSTTQVGDWVLAIGSPFGFESSARAGIVSAKSRSGGYQGQSFAIPIKVTMNVERQIVQHGKVDLG